MSRRRSPCVGGVYKAGFATRQEPYDHAVAALFAALHWAEDLLEHRRFLAGDVLAEADIRLFTTQISLEPVAGAEGNGSFSMTR